MSKKKSLSGRAEKPVEPQPVAQGLGTHRPEDNVRLKSFMGIRPGVYLAGLYGLILLLVLFFILLYPGISKPGSMITVNSEPRGAAVLVDGVYREATPCKIFVARGHHQIELDLPGFLPRQVEKDVGGRLFASALFPLQAEISEKLESEKITEAFNDSAAEYAAWTFTGEPSAAYQIPQSLSEGVYRLGPGATDPAVRKSMDDTITASARFAVTRASLRDLIRAKSLLDNQGLSPSPVSLLGSAEDIIAYLEENPEAALWLASVLNGDAQSALTGSPWYTAAASAGQGPQNSGGTQSPAQAKDIQAGPLKFRMINGGSLSGVNFPAGTWVDSFYISETVVSASAWESFLEQEPMWKIDNIDELMKEGLVKEEYLNAADFPGAPAEGVSGISWYAARAFCEWLNAFIPSRESWEVRLPTEAEWEYAAKAGALGTSESSGPKDAAEPKGSGELSASGSFWEWCEDPFAPLCFLSVSPAAAAALSSPERSLRGGSWINPAGSVKSETRGSLPPSFCSPFVSFRPVIVRKEPQPVAALSPRNLP